MSDKVEQVTQDFGSFHAFLTTEIAKLEGEKRGKTLAEKSALNKRLKPLRSLLKKAEMVRGK